MVEQGTHKPLDVGSNPTLATRYTGAGSLPKQAALCHIWGWVKIRFCASCKVLRVIPCFS